MSATSCELAPSPRSSGGEIQCTEEELFDSFMEIVNDNQRTSNSSERTSSHKEDEDVNSNKNIDVSSDDTAKIEVNIVNNGCCNSEFNSKETYNNGEETMQNPQLDKNSNDACKSIDEDDVFTQNNASLSPNEHELSQNDDFNESQNISNEQPKEYKSDKLVNSEEKDSYLEQSEMNKDHTTTFHSSEKTDCENSMRKDGSQTEKITDSCQGEETQIEDQNSSSEIVSHTSIQNMLQEEKNQLQSIQQDIQEGIRMATQVCDEIQEILIKRMSCSSDEILSDKTADSPESSMVTTSKTEDDANQPSIDVVIPEGNTSNNQMPGFLITSQGNDSSSTSSSLQEGTHHSDEVIDRKKSISDSLDSSEGSLSGETLSTGASSSSAQGSIDWDILNTALENPDTDEDDRGIYESTPHGSFGGFGLMFDVVDGADKLAVEDDSRRRTISQSSTISECEFQEEYRKQHNAESLDRRKDGVLCSGYLLKLGGTGIIPKNWRKRWCVLRHDRCLYYYKTTQDIVPCGIVVLTNYVVSRSSEFHKKNCLKISKGGGRTYFFIAESPDDMLKWMDALRKAADAIDEGTNFEIRKEIIHNVAIPALSIKKPDCHGYLTKKGARNRASWKRRYCVLKNGCLYYYREMADTTALGVAKLHGYKLEEVTFSGKRPGFRAVPPISEMRTFSFIPDNEFDKKRWIPCLEQSIQSSSTSS